MSKLTALRLCGILLFMGAFLTFVIINRNLIYGSTKTHKSWVRACDVDITSDSRLKEMVDSCLARGWPTCSIWVDMAMFFNPPSIDQMAEMYNGPDSLKPNK